MRKITLTADARLIEKARLVAKFEHKTLATAFREWLEFYASRGGSLQDFHSLMSGLSHIDAGLAFARDEMNER